MSHLFGSPWWILSSGLTATAKKALMLFALGEGTEVVRKG